MNDDKTRTALRGSAVSIGAELNQTFRIDSLIAVGGMGEVFKGHNIQTGDPVAIKIVLPEYAQDVMMLGLFRREARILNHLNHDAIVRYHVFSYDPVLSRPYLAMEFVDGPSLATHMRRTPLTASESMPLLRRLADGLHRAHLAGVIHRDMSPDNIILAGGLVENAKIIDFGIARSANVGGETLLGGSFAGKYNFVSPEQAGLYGSEVTPKSDVYSLALVIAAAVRGRPIDMGGSPVDLIEKRRAVPDLTDIPKELHPVLSAMLTPNPTQRPDMAAVRDWPYTQLAEKPTFDEAKVTAGSPPAVLPTRRSNIRRIGVFAIAVAAVIGIGALSGWIFSKGNIVTSNDAPSPLQMESRQAETLLAKSPDSVNQVAAGEDITSLQALVDHCGADCPQDFIKQVQQRIDALKQRVALHTRLVSQLSAAGRDISAVQRFLDQCGTNCPADLAEQARQQIATLTQERAALHDRLASQLSAAGQDISAVQRFLDQCGTSCPTDLAEQAHQRIETSTRQELLDRLAAQLTAAGQDIAALQDFLKQCRSDCPADLAEQARQRIENLTRQSALHDRLASQLTAAGQDISALRRFLDQCGVDCPGDLAERARQQIEALSQRAALHDRLSTQLAAASPDISALRHFLDQCGSDCPGDLAEQARKQIENLKRNVANHERLEGQLTAASQDISAVQRFLDQCGTDCPGDLAERARERIESLKRQTALQDRLTSQLTAAGEDISAVQHFLDQCGTNCPAELSQRARQQIASIARKAALHESLQGQLTAAGQNISSLQRFLEQCGADCPVDLAGQARLQIATLTQQAALHDRLAGQLAAASQNILALKNFLDQCGSICPGDLARQAQERLDNMQQQLALHDRLVAPANAPLRDCHDCPELVPIAAGSFMMGAPIADASAAASERPAHRADVPAFMLSRFPITFDEWQACVNDGGCSKSPTDAGWGKGRRPVINITWFDANAYAQWLSRKTKHSYRLPSETEWEYAARAGTTGPYYWGSDETKACDFANVYDGTASKVLKFNWKPYNCSDGFIYTAPVGSFAPNAWNFGDMIGNVWQWVADCWTDDYSGATGEAFAVSTGSCTDRVLRGGSWMSDAASARVSTRMRVDPSESDINIGFRVAREAP